MRNNFLKHVLLVVFLLLSLAFVECSGDKQVDKELKVYAAEINKDCPITYDQYTRLDSCEALSGKILKYNYTVDFEKLNITEDELESKMKPYLLGGVKIASEMKGLRDREVTFSYSYRGKDGNLIREFKITPDDYKSNNKK